MDKVTEAIAHFIGLFQMAVEEARIRDKYLEFDEEDHPEEALPEIVPVDYRVRAPHEFQDMEPELRHVPQIPEVEKLWPDSFVSIPFFPGPIPWLTIHPLEAGHLQAFGWSFSLMAPPVTPFLPPPGSVVVLITQRNLLQDGDTLLMGEGATFASIAGIERDPTSLLAEAGLLSPLGVETLPGSTETMKDFVTGLSARFDEFANSDPAAEGFLLRAETISGKFLDGEAVEDLPKLADHRVRVEEDGEPAEETPTGLKENGPDHASGEHVQVIVSGDGAISVELDTGGNSVINEASLVSAMLDGTVFAVMGDCHEVNAIVQVNAWADNDMIGSALANWGRLAAEGTTAFNLARFERENMAAPDPAEAKGLPDDFIFTRIDGDLIFMNWIEQINFVSDNDIAIMTTGGLKTMATLGGNMAYNGISLTELGHHYDLILVGGSMYDANIISQSNVLLDNDVMGGVAGFSTSGEAGYTASGNLLWNEASIKTIGGADRFEPLPEHFREAAASFKAGNPSLPDPVFADPAFLGLEGLRVLYVSGDLFDIQYISQTNVLGDSDQVALAMSKVKPVPDAKWSVATGGNELINVANIVDLDTTGKTYVGGEHYSDELLFQAELVDFDAPIAATPNADALVNEAVAFLIDDDAAPDSLDPLSTIGGSLVPDAPDGVQSMLA